MSDETKKRTKLRVFCSLRYPASPPSLLDFRRSAAIFVTVRDLGISSVLWEGSKKHDESYKLEVLDDRRGGGGCHFGCRSSSECPMLRLLSSGRLGLLLRSSLCAGVLLAVLRHVRRGGLLWGELLRQ